MLYAILILAALAVFFAVLLIRAALLRPPEDGSDGARTPPAPDTGEVGRFQKVLRLKTVWPREGKIEYEQFDAFLPLLRELYPTVFENTELSVVNRYGVILRWKGSDPDREPVILMAHHDVVSAEDADWSSPPFDANIRDGKIYARGAVDTKCIITAVLEAETRLMEEGFRPERDVYFITSNNEETGGDTTPAQVEWFRERNIKPDFVLDEGGAMIDELPLGIRHEFAMIGVSEKGVVDVKLTARGEAGHSSTPCDKDSTFRLLDALNAIRSHPFKACLSPVTAEMLRKLGAHAPFGFRIVFANIPVFAPIIKKIMAKGGETNAMIRTTTSLTQLSGSDTINTIPTEAGAGFSVRVAAWNTTEEVEKRLRELCGEHVTLGIPYRQEPSPCSDFRSEAYRLIADTARKVYPGADDAPYIMNGGTDSKHFTAICDNVFRFCGFHFTSEERHGMHGVDEHLSVDSYLKGIEFYERLLRSL
ncbi:MAG: M20/M25/M40 family metallo-hydrolase [Clostridia bacterium]|nr:M20/M25/M40 family metallo-hydrolase [Clostridia bacterium]